MTKKEEAEIQALLTSLWERNLPLLHQRLDILDRTASAAMSGRLTEADRKATLDIAHKLSGSLGMFGYQQGTEIARRIEQILSSPTPATLGRLTALSTDLRRILTNK